MMRSPVAPVSLPPSPDDSALTLLSSLLAQTEMLMSLGFLQLQLVGINRNRKSVPLPHFASFWTNYCPFKSSGRLGTWKQILCL